MHVSISPYRLSRLTQGLALVLIALMGLQGMPIQSLIQHVSSEHICEERGFCPRSGGECQCNHHGPTTTSKSSDADASQLIFVQPCPTDHGHAVGPTAPAKWLVSSQEWTLVSPTRNLGGHTYSSRVSQPVIDDIYRPPWHAGM